MSTEASSDARETGDASETGDLRGPVRLDAHLHVWDLAVRDQPWTRALPALRRSFGIADVQPALRASGFDGAILVQTVCVPGETPELLGIADTLGAAEAAGTDAGTVARTDAGTDTGIVAGVVGWVDLRSSDVADVLQGLRSGPGGDRLVGIRHQVQDELEPDWLARPDVRRGLGAVADAGLVYDLVITPRQLPDAIAAVRALPQLSFVLDHGGKPAIASIRMQPWRDGIVALAAQPNAAVKLSGLFTQATLEPPLDDALIAQVRPYADELLLAFGLDRVMYGSDWPVSLLVGGYAEVVEATDALLGELSGPERAAVLGGTAAHWYGVRS